MTELRTVPKSPQIEDNNFVLSIAEVTALRTSALLNGATLSLKIINTRKFFHKGQARIEMSLRKPSGRRVYFAVVYENGSISSVV